MMLRRTSANIYSSGYWNNAPATKRVTLPYRIGQISALTLSICLSSTTFAEIEWTNTYAPGAWPTATAACVNGEVEARIQALRTANPSIQYRYKSLSVNEYLSGQEARCQFVIERKLAFYWVTTAMGPVTHMATGSPDACPEGSVDDSGYCQPKNAGVPECPSNGSNPINSATGNKYQQEQDYVGTGAQPLQFIRHYNALSQESGPLGDNWRHHYQRSLVVTGLGSGSPSRVKLYRADGKRYNFNLTGGTWQPDADQNYRLQRQTDGNGNTSGWTLTTSDDTIERYAAQGRLISITSRAGQTHHLSYDTQNRLQTVTDTDGRTLTLAYDTHGRIASVTDPAGEPITFSYDANNRLISTTYADSSSRQYRYNESSLTAGANLPRALTGIIDENNTRFADFEYDTQGRAVRSSHSGGAGEVSISYAANGERTLTDALGASRTFTYSSILDTLKNTGISQACNTCGGAAQTRQYDAQGNVSQRVDFNNVPTQYTYDLSRNLPTIRTEASGTAVERTISTTWHPTYRLPVQVDEGNRRTEYSYDSNGHLISRTLTDMGQTPALSRTWSWTYDNQGRVLTADGPRTDISDITTYSYYACTTGAECGRVKTITNALNHTTQINSYNAHGQPLSITDANGLVTTFTYDLRLRLTAYTQGTETTTLTYWPTGLLHTLTQPDGSTLTYTYDAAQRLTRLEDSQGNHIEYTLDALGNQTQTRSYDPSSTLAMRQSQTFNTLNRLVQTLDAAGTPAVTTHYTYDNNGNLTETQAPLNRDTQYAYDAHNRLTQVTDPNTEVTQYSYNALDQLIAVIDPLNHATYYHHNALGDLSLLQSPDTGDTTYTHDSAGNLASSTDARGVTATYSYDSLNRLTQLSYPDQTYTYVYDQGINGTGRLTHITDHIGTLDWTYTAQGQVANRTHTLDGHSFAQDYTYNAAGQRLSLTLPSGNSLHYTYTPSGQISSISLNGITPLLSAIQYRPFGPVQHWSWGNGTTHNRDYNTDGDLTGITSGGQTQYLYDDARRITQQNEVNPPGISHTYSYDLLDRLTTATGTGLNQSWSYDANGNRLTETGSTPATFTQALDSNRLTHINGSLTRTYTYDAAGNILGDGHTLYTYNDAGRLSSATRYGQTTQYDYNALGQRVRKSNNNGVRYFVYDDAGQLAGEYDANGQLIQETVWLGNIPVATLRPAGSGVAVYYIHTDHLNTPRRISRASDNQIVWRWDNDPFGRHTANEDPDGDSQLFTFSLRYPGQYYDEESGLHYNYFRDYDPSTGRYIQSDPIGLQGGINTYLYANANPLVYIDPLGLAPGMGSRGASAMEAIGDAIDQGLCGWWPGHPDCWSMCVRWRCERDGDCGEKEYYSIGRGSPYVASPSYDPNNDDKCECVMRCVPGQPNCRGLNTQ